MRRPRSNLIGEPALWLLLGILVVLLVGGAG
jgi:hypothetical protein